MDRWVVEVRAHHDSDSRSKPAGARMLSSEPIPLALSMAHSRFPIANVKVEVRTRWASGIGHLACCIALCTACATMPAQSTPTVPVITWEQKLAWMTRLEDQRILRDPDTPAPVVLRPATKNAPAIVAPPPPSDLIRLLADSEARVRRRAALAIGRVGLAEGVDQLARLLASDDDPEVRQM